MQENTINQTQKQEDLSGKVILPTGYLSWSQINCWLTNKERYRKEYFEKRDKLDTKYLRFGKGIAKMIEDGSYKQLLPNLQVCDTPEFEIRVDILGVPVIGFIDSYDSINHIFLEYKTSKHPWTQAKVQKHDQLTLYATMLKHKTGKIPEYCDLIWIETVEGGLEVEDFWRTNEKALNVTGKLVTFRREFDEREIDRMEDIIAKCAEEISEAYQEFIKEI